MRPARLLAVVLLAAAPLAARAVDAPHEDGLYCSNCHTGHNAVGAGLTKVGGNFNLCNSCHLNYDGFGFPTWTDAIQAVPGVSGSSHRWDAPASNLGAIPPSAASADLDEQAMGERLDEGKLMCSTCHDQHAADALAVGGRGRQTVSAVTRIDALTDPGTGVVSVAGDVGASATAKSYLIDMVAAGSETTALFRLSNDNGKSWFGCTTPTTYSYVAYAANGCQAGPGVPLNDGTNVSVAFGAGTYAVGDQFKLYVSYPFLRVSIDAAKMCVTCHKDRNMTTENVQGTGTHAGLGGSVVPGTTVFHHPVGEALAAAPLDASGVVQTSGDGNTSNDLVLGTGGLVNCLTCHRAHHADSNSLSVGP
jgi:predicted CXXCH cytochrome family protein